MAIRPDRRNPTAPAAGNPGDECTVLDPGRTGADSGRRVWTVSYERGHPHHSRDLPVHEYDTDVKRQFYMYLNIIV